MNKQTFSLGIVAVGILIAGRTLPAFAEEVEIDCVADPTNEACLVTTDDEPVDESFDPDANNETVNGTTDGNNNQTNDTDSTADESDPETEEEEEAPAWPMYLSFGALGAAVLVFIVLNLAGGKAKQK